MAKPKPFMLARRVLSACLLIVAGAAVSCSKSQGNTTQKEASGPFDGPEREVPGRVFLVGIDAANAPVFDPAMDDGLMPNLAGLVRDGTRGVLESIEPTASAIIWTTLATGKEADKHGIHGFVAPGKDGEMVPVTSNMRRVKALWNIASEQGISTGFLSWWATWPAEPVRGFMCSDYTWPLKKSGWGFATDADPEQERSYRTYPPELLGALDQFVKTESSTPPDELEALGIAAIPRVKGYAVRDMLLKDVSLGAMSAHLLNTHQPSLYAVYFDGFDAYCHLYWPYYKRYMRARRLGPSALSDLPPDQRALGAALDAHLTRLDTYLGEIMRHAGPDDVVMVFSDHGYGDNPGKQPILRGSGDWIRPPHWHTLDGFVAAVGGPIVPGGTVSGASVRDITPTVLALLGLPVGRDMDGKVLTGLLTEAFLAAHPVRFIDTYETGPRGGAPIESPYDEEMIAHLNSLGYLDG